MNVLDLVSTSLIYLFFRWIKSQNDYFERLLRHCVWRYVSCVRLHVYEIRSAYLLLWQCEWDHLVSRLININMLSSLVYGKNLPTRPDLQKFRKWKTVRHDEESSWRMSSYRCRADLWLRVMKAWVEVSDWGTKKMEDRLEGRQKSDKNTQHREGVSGMWPRLTHTLVQAYKRAGGGWSSAADGCKSPMMTKGRLKPWNIITYPRSGTDLRQAIQP